MSFMEKKITSIVVLEDSKKGGFGGGQRGSLEVIDALSESFQIIIGDTAKESKFAEELNKRHLPMIPLKSTIRVSGSKSASFSMNWKEYLVFPIHLLGNVFRIKKYLFESEINSKNVLLYAAHKKRLVEAWILKVFWRFQYVYHIRTFDAQKHPLYLLTQFWMKSAVFNIAVSQAVKDNYNLSNVKVVHNPLCQKVVSKPRSIQQPFIVAVFATLLEWKGLDVFMQSYNYLKNKNSIRYEIYGEGPDRDKLMKFETENVSLMGYSDNVSDIMEERISLVCVPSIKPESFGRVSLEAFAFGIPAIASDLGGQPEIIDDGVNGFLVEPGNPQIIADRIDRIFNDRDLYKQFSLKAIEKANNFSYEQYRFKIVELFKSVNKHSH